MLQLDKRPQWLLATALICLLAGLCTSGGGGGILQVSCQFPTTNPTLSGLTKIPQTNVANHSTLLEKDFLAAVNRLSDLLPYLSNKDIQEADGLIMAMPLRSVLACAKFIETKPPVVPHHCCLFEVITSKPCIKPKVKPKPVLPATTRSPMNSSVPTPAITPLPSMKPGILPTSKPSIAAPSTKPPTTKKPLTTTTKPPIHRLSRGGPATTSKPFGKVRSSLPVETSDIESTSSSDSQSEPQAEMRSEIPPEGETRAADNVQQADEPMDDSEPKSRADGEGRSSAAAAAAEAEAEE